MERKYPWKLGSPSLYTYTTPSGLKIGKSFWTYRGEYLDRDGVGLFLLLDILFFYSEYRLTLISLSLHGNSCVHPRCFPARIIITAEPRGVEGWGGLIGKKWDKTLCEVFMYLIVCWKEGFYRSLKLYLTHSDPTIANFYVKIS